ncbi:hypothetical protein ACFWUP_00020 [Nocardia sp. NPDC058658]|uniref:hypothetical protein n=1 Tax=Nocardia sp. NPDC058658 TaxID=3346580 RepID=UPI0036570A68
MRLLSVTATAAILLSLGTATAAAQPDPSDSPRQAVARTYLDALVSHDAGAVPFAPNATRIEMGVQTGFSGPGMAAELDHGPLQRAIQGIRNVTLVETGDVVTAHYLLDAGLVGVRLATVSITETFVIPDGTIHFIEATIVPVAG